MIICYPSTLFGTGSSKRVERERERERVMRCRERGLKKIYLNPRARVVLYPVRVFLKEAAAKQHAAFSAPIANNALSPRLAR
jgi:hypothetical protein